MRVTWTTERARPRLLDRVPLPGIGEPLLRNGLALSLSAVLSSAIGFAFWLLAAHHYSPTTVGEDAVAISALQLVGGVAQLNLANGMIRFLPSAGAHRRRFVLTSYAVATAFALVLGVGFVLVAPALAPALGHALSSPIVDALWVVSTAAWAVFALEDGALTGLRHARWVPIENAGHGVMKAALVVPLALLVPASGIVLAWGIATIATIAVTNVFVFGRAVPAEVRRAPAGGIDVNELRRYLPFDYLAALCWLASTNLLPIFIIRRAGAEASAFFSLAWVVTYVLYLVSISLGSSLIVEAIADPADLLVRGRRVVGQLLRLVTPAVALVVIGAPLILRLFGSAYAAGGVTTLRVLALSALPFTLVSTVIAALRVQRRTHLVFAINATILVLVGGVTWFALPHFGILAAAYAWLGTQCLVAAVMIGALVLPLAAIRRELSAAGTACALAGARLLAKSGAPRVRLPRRRTRAAWPAITDDVLADLAVLAPETAAAVADVEVISGGSDLVVLAPHDAAGEILAVVKVPDSEPARVDLIRQDQILGGLAADRRLGRWRDLVPVYRLVEGVRVPLFSIETPMRGTSGLQLLEKDPSLATALTAHALTSIDKMHRRSSRRTRLDDAGVHRLLDPLLAPVRTAHPTGRVPARQLETIERLHERLAAALRGRTVSLSWVHGDFSPENVLFSPESLEVSAVVDWGQGTDAGIGALDVLSWVLAVARVGERSELGSQLSRLLAVEAWPEEGLLAAAGEAVAQTGLGHREVVLLYWLSHVGTNVAKCEERYVRNPMWWVGNVESVLEAFRRLPG